MSVQKNYKVQQISGYFMGRKKRSDRTKPDHWTIKAKSEGFEARSVYKLEEMNKRFQIFERPKRVLDLGCAPGSWSQLIRKRFPKSTIVGIDIKMLNKYSGIFLHGSILDTPTEIFLEHLGGQADLVISDMAPNTTGTRLTDHVRQIELAKMALETALRTLRMGGNFVVKVFDGEDAYDFVQSIRPHFEKTRRVKPKVTRNESVEFFVIGLHRKEVDTK